MTALSIFGIIIAYLVLIAGYAYFAFKIVEGIDFRWLGYNGTPFWFFPFAQMVDESGPGFIPFLLPCGLACIFLDLLVVILVSVVFLFVVASLAFNSL